MADVTEDRRKGVRISVHGVAVCYGDNLPLRGTIENLSTTGALINVGGTPSGAMLEVELALGAHRGRVTARPVRIEAGPRRTRIALRFAQVDAPIQSVIDMTIDRALAAAARRPVLVLDDDTLRRGTLVAALTQRGMSPVAPRTPLDAIEVMTNAQAAVAVALLAPSYGASLASLQQLVSDSFPWVRAAEITDDLDETLERAQTAWATHSLARARA